MTWHHRVSTVDADDQNRRSRPVSSGHRGDGELRPCDEAHRRDHARRRAESVIPGRHRQARVRREHRRIPEPWFRPAARRTDRASSRSARAWRSVGTVAGAIVFRWSGWPLLGLTLFVAGGASNWLDRVVRGSVIDFINVGVGSLRTGIFNVADVAIMLGVASSSWPSFGAAGPARAFRRRRWTVRQSSWIVAESRVRVVRGNGWGGSMIPGTVIRVVGAALVVVGLVLLGATGAVASALGAQGGAGAVPGASDPASLAFWFQLSFIRLFGTTLIGLGVVLWWCRTHLRHRTTAVVAPSAGRSHRRLAVLWPWHSRSPSGLQALDGSWRVRCCSSPSMCLMSAIKPAVAPVRLTRARSFTGRARPAMQHAIRISGIRTILTFVGAPGGVAVPLAGTTNSVMLCGGSVTTMLLPLRVRSVRRVMALAE